MWCGRRIEREKKRKKQQQQQLMRDAAHREERERWINISPVQCGVML